MWGIYRWKMFGRTVSQLRAPAFIAPCLLFAGVWGATGHRVLSLISLALFLFFAGVSFFYLSVWPPKWEELTTRQKYDIPFSDVVEDEEHYEEWKKIHADHPEWP